MKDEVETTNKTYTDDFLVALAQKLGLAATASAVFGEPIEREGVTVIPVAQARFGFGGGSGRRRDTDGAGGGGGVLVSPIGFIEIRNGEARFKRIITLSPSLLAVGGLAGFLVLRVLLRRR